MFGPSQVLWLSNRVQLHMSWPKFGPNQVLWLSNQVWSHIHPAK